MTTTALDAVTFVRAGLQECAAALDALIANVLTGRPDTALGRAADVADVTAGGRYADRVQELHIEVVHLFIELIERDLAPANY